MGQSLIADPLNREPLPGATIHHTQNLGQEQPTIPQLRKKYTTIKQIRHMEPRALTTVHFSTRKETSQFDLFTYEIYSLILQ